MNPLREMTLKDKREFVRRFGRVRVKERGMPDDILLDWAGLIALVDECVEFSTLSAEVQTSPTG